MAVRSHTGISRKRLQIDLIRQGKQELQYEPRKQRKSIETMDNTEVLGHQLARGRKRAYCVICKKKGSTQMPRRTMLGEI